jgi:hypothetical protein
MKSTIVMHCKERRWYRTLLCFGSILFSIGNEPLHAFARTSFTPRNITTDSVYELAMANYWYYKYAVANREQETWNGFMFFATPLYQRSTNRNNPGRYFLPNNKCSVQFAEDGTGDVGSLWLGLIAPDGESFTGTLSLNPRRTVAGAYLQAYIDLSWICMNSWLSVCLAAVRAQHNIGVCTRNSSANGTLVVNGYAIKTIKDALDNPAWEFGKFSRCSLEKGGVDDIQIKLGHDWFYNDCMNHYSLYLIGTVPTGDRLTGAYIFEPQVGTNSGSIGFGINADYTAWQTEYSQWTLMTDLKYRHVLDTREIRSFDLTPNGDWSRFLQVVFEAEPANTLPGINYFTQRVKVKQGAELNWWLALHYQYCDVWHAELGYNYWYRHAEQICGVCDLGVETLGIFDLASCCGILSSANDANISQSIVPPNQPTSDGVTFVPLTADRLYKKSAAHPKAVSNTVYGTLGYETNCGCVPVMVSAGASGEIGRNCAALTQWALWLKMGCAF